MITNEDILLSFPDQLIQTTETSCRVDSFEAFFDPNQSWLLRTPFDPTALHFEVGLIVQIARTTGVNPKSGIYLIDSTQSHGMQLRVAGYENPVGRGPGLSFGSDMLKVSIFDFSASIRASQKKVDSIVKTEYQLNDKFIRARVDEVVKVLTLIRLCSSSDSLKTSIGMTDVSLLELESRLIEEVKSDLLHYMARNKDSTGRWTRLVR